MALPALDPVRSGPASAGLLDPVAPVAPRASVDTLAVDPRRAMGTVRGVENPVPRLQAPKAPGASTPADAQGFIRDPALIRSPAVLADYVAWVRDFDAVTARGSAPRAYRDLSLMLYDRQIGRPWGDEAFFRELNIRLTEFRRHFCAGDLAAACTMPESVNDGAGLQSIAATLTDPRIIEAMRVRHGVSVQPVVYPNDPRAFDLMIGRRESNESATQQYWGLQPAQVQWTFATPVQRGVNGSRASLNNGEAPGQFAIGRSGIVVDDWQLRDRAMELAHRWRAEVDIARSHPPTNPQSDSEAIQYLRLLDEHRAEFAATYERLLAIVGDNAEARARFVQARVNDDYPEEVYQHVAYAQLRGMVRTLSGYYALAVKQRGDTSMRQIGLESLLTLQRYEPSWRLFMLELTTQSQPLAARAALIDQVADPVLAYTYVTEQLKAILGMDVYANSDLFDRYRYAIMADELFQPRYLQEYAPAIYQELVQPDGTLRRVADLPREDQLRILRRYLMTSDTQQSLSGTLRMRAVLAARINEQDLRHLAEVIHQARYQGR